ncbi:hypothetical protein HYFRA_00008272 [Hymenoscyphus fraxineus]|uniref:AB hydrolase-1 domain-containing protein n=1 Tax=Hymenoscyphus fraxineus TaxID=746836 RepID=A0A9N9KQ32_9HELO|nr:hypothetical protein HYFRA_00008272 [Hymenoscyphus fraxineus]
MALNHLPPATGKTLQTPDGVKYAYAYSAAAAKKPTFLLLHGFPSSSYDWRHQVKKLSELGYGVIVPDLLGYGDTDSPTDLERYKMKKMATDVSLILEKESLETVIGVAHDWGVGILSRLANYFPEKFSGYIFMSVPYIEPGPFPLDAINAMTEQNFGYTAFGYWPFFNEDDAGDICDKNNTSFTSLVYPQTHEMWKTDFAPLGACKSWVTSNTVKPLPTWFPESEAATHAEIIAKNGYRGPLNWYKVTIRGLNTEDEAQIPEENKIIKTPTLVVVTDKDYVCRAESANQISPKSIPNLAIKTILGCGHWPTLEAKDETNEILIKFAAVIEGRGKLGDI